MLPINVLGSSIQGLIVRSISASISCRTQLPELAYKAQNVPEGTKALPIPRTKQNQKVSHEFNVLMYPTVPLIRVEAKVTKPHLLGVVHLRREKPPPPEGEFKGFMSVLYYQSRKTEGWKITIAPFIQKGSGHVSMSQVWLINPPLCPYSWLGF